MEAKTDWFPILATAVGAFGLIVEFAFPRYAKAAPWAQWGHGVLQAGRFTRIVACLALIVVGLGAYGVIPEEFGGLLLGVFFVAFVAGFAQDMATKAVESQGGGGVPAQTRPGTAWRRRPKRRKRKR